MTRSLSAEPSKPSSSSKRKGTRSVSTLTPSQLARKRANDREAQRAIRARTKEHIERLERELEDLRGSQGRDKTVQELLRRNKALEDELRQLKESMGVAMTSSPYSAPTAYNDDSCGAIPSPRMSPLPSGAADYISDYSQTTQQYVPMPNCEAWASNLPSSVPSPASSVNTDEYGPAGGYIPTSVPSSMMSSAGIGIVDNNKEVKMEYEGMNDMMNAQGYMQHNHHQQRPQGWNMYPGMYYDGAQNAVISR
ncbi:bZIP transcription factor [Metarhizium rileyi]|uniref:BZIP transcription factor n=1 Tax=Metarhizium rileyi (strain RCEF 4871) TaxID=1649241 RepID=A0A167EMV7_METRR|nr:bZIP transcription factor [Metarhizium rileyi RCEF 4871]TWU72045.1 hypothetical protein ED733_002051 [Metarhizium rileyi]